MRHPATLHTITCILIALLAARAFAADEAAVFEQLYGEQLRHVNATRSTDDDVELAARLMAAAGSVGASPVLQVIIYEKAFDLGLGSPDGIATSLASYERLAELTPESIATYRDRLLNAMRVQYARSKGDQKRALGQSYLATLLTAADELMKENAGEAARLARMAVPLAAEVDAAQVEHVRRKVDALTALAVARSRARQLHDRIAADPNDQTAAKALTELYLIELDDPKQAATVAPASGDVDLILWTSKAAGEPAGTIESDSLAMGDWYAGLSRQASATSRAAMMQRAAGWYRRYLDLHTAEDVARLKAQVLLNQLNDQLQELGLTVQAAVASPTPVPTAPATAANPPAIAGRVAPLLKDVSATESIKLDDATRPYVIEGQLLLVSPMTGRVDLEIGPGVQVEGGRIQMSRLTRVIVKGTPDRPVVLRNITFGQDISSGFEAEYAILDNCRFQKTGRSFQVNGYTTKWTFSKCLLYQCAFPSLKKVDWGVKFLETSLVNTTIEGAGGDIRHVWNAIRNCNFIACTIHPSVGIRTVDCNFYTCRFTAPTNPQAQADAIEPVGPLMVQAYLSGTPAAAVRAAWTPIGPNVQLNPVLAAFPVFKFDCVSPIPALRNDRTARGLLFAK